MKWLKVSSSAITCGMPRRTLLFLVSLPLLIASLSGCAITQAVRVVDRERLDVKYMIEELSDTPLIFLGERHDVAAHHQLQLEVLKGLKAQGKKLAIAMEMFEETAQPALDAWSAGKVPERAFVKVYEWNWRFIPWGMYRDLMLFARDNRIPVIAVNAPREVVQTVGRKGFAALSPDELAKLPPGVDATVGDEYLLFMRSNLPRHGKSGGGIRNIAEAQLLRNKVMARKITEYLQLHPGTTVVVIAGGGHARGTGGIAAELGKGIAYKIVLPPIPPLNEENVTGADADYLLVETPL